MTNEPEKTKLEGEQAGQPANPSAAWLEGAPKSEGNNGLPVDALASVVQAAVEKAMEGYTRREQSARDKMEARIKKNVQDTLAAVQGAGIEVTDDLKKAVQARVREQVASETDQPVDFTQKPAQAETQKATEPAQPRVAIAKALMDEYGVQLYDNDPETATIDQSSMAAFTRTLTAALEAKKARKAQADQAAAQVRAPAAPVGGQHTGLMEQYQKELATTRGVDAVYALKEKYRKAGLQL